MQPKLPSVDVREANRRRREEIAAGGQPALIVDVREPWECAEVRPEDALELPMSQLPAALDQLPRDRELLFICRSGNRSGQVVAYLQANGWEGVSNVEGGMLAWEAAGLPVERGR